MFSHQLSPGTICKDPFINCFILDVLRIITKITWFWNMHFFITELATNRNNQYQPDNSRKSTKTPFSGPRTLLFSLNMSIIVCNSPSIYSKYTISASLNMVWARSSVYSLCSCRSWNTNRRCRRLNYSFKFSEK